MVSADGFFSEDAMKKRDSKLFLELVGRHLPPTTRISEPMKGSLSSYLMQRLDQECGDPCTGDADADAKDGNAAEATASEGWRKRPRVEGSSGDQQKDAAEEEGSGSEDDM